MDSPRVYLICINRLVCEAVTMLLRREGIAFLGMETDPDLALAEIGKLEPNVVLVEGDGAQADGALMSRLAQLVYQKRNLSVIRLSMSDGLLQVYHQERRRLITTQDLIQAVRSPGGSASQQIAGDKEAA